MKKMIVSVLTLMTMAMLTLTGCAKFQCSICGEEKMGVKYTVSVLGEEIEMCKDCKKDLEQLKKDFLGE